MAREVVLAAREVRKTYGDVVALEAIDVDVYTGEFVALLGPTGCGKSTFLNLVAGFEPVTRGVLQVAGQDVRGPGPDREVVFQEHGLYPWLTVEQNIGLGPRILRADARAVRHSRVREYTELVGLTGFEKHYPHQLSGGMRQRVSLARTLINDPKILLMDEPFAALDAITRVQMQDFLLSVWGVTRATVMFVTHDVDEALLLADRVFVMSPRPGRIVNEVAVRLPRPRTHALTTTDEFVAHKRSLLDSLESTIKERTTYV